MLALRSTLGVILTALFENAHDVTVGSTAVADVTAFAFFAGDGRCALGSVVLAAVRRGVLHQDVDFLIFGNQNCDVVVAVVGVSQTAVLGHVLVVVVVIVVVFLFRLRPVFLRLLRVQLETANCSGGGGGGGAGGFLLHQVVVDLEGLIARVVRPVRLVKTFSTAVHFVVDQVNAGSQRRRGVVELAAFLFVVGLLRRPRHHPDVRVIERNAGELHWNLNVRVRKTKLRSASEIEKGLSRRRSLRQVGDLQ